MNYTLSANIAGLSIAVTYLVIFTVGENRSDRARYILITGMLTAVVIFLFNILVITGQWGLSKFLFVIAIPLQYAFYPILNVYISTFISHENKIIIDIKNFILPVLVCVSLIIVLLKLNETEIISLISAVSSYKSDFPEKLDEFIWILYSAYYAQFFYFLKKFIDGYKKLNKDKEYSFTSKWIKYIIIGITVYELAFFTAWNFIENIFFLDAVMGSFVVLFIGIIGIKHDEILLGMQIAKSFENVNFIPNQRKINSKIDIGFQREIINKMKIIIEEEKLFLSPNLKIKNFAKRLHIPEKELSIIINENIGKNFSTFINEFRIKEACNLLSNKEIKISEISLLVGFFSRAAFDNTFKKFTGLTPSEYRRSL